MGYQIVSTTMESTDIDDDNNDDHGGLPVELSNT